MKYFTVFVCLGAVAALPAEDVMLKKDDMPVNKTDLPNMNRHKIINAYNAADEYEYWISHNLTEMDFSFLDEHGIHKPAIIEKPTTSNQSTEALKEEEAYVKKHVKFHYFNKFDNYDLRGQQFDSVDELNDWRRDLPVKVIIHGFLNSIRSPAIQHIKNMYLNNTGPVNIIGVDWSHLVGTSDILGLPVRVLRYDLARHHVPAVGFRVGEMIDALIDANLTDLNNIHIIGHSLGAHVAGIAGKDMVHGSPARITGLDPAGPLFFLTGPDGRLSHTDAMFVDVIHTDAFSIEVPFNKNGLFGHPAHAGHIDFYLNGGHLQPQCIKLLQRTCSHNMAVDYFASTIGSGNEKKYEGFYCSTLPMGSKNCLSVHRDGRMKLKAFMGDKVSTVKYGPYYVDYDGDYPVIKF